MDNRRCFECYSFQDHKQDLFFVLCPYTIADKKQLMLHVQPFIRPSTELHQIHPLQMVGRQPSPLIQTLDQFHTMMEQRIQTE